MALTLAGVEEMIEAAGGDFGHLAGQLRDEVRPQYDGDWAWTTPAGKKVRIDDLPVEVIERIAAAHGMNWQTLMRWPAQTPTMAWDVYLECCKFVGDEPIERPANAGEFLDFTALVERIAKDRAVNHGEGGVPLEDETETT